MNDKIFSYANITNMKAVLQHYIDNGGNVNYAEEKVLLAALNDYATSVLISESK